MLLSKGLYIWLTHTLLGTWGEMWDSPSRTLQQLASSTAVVRQSLPLLKQSSHSKRFCKQTAAAGPSSVQFWHIIRDVRSRKILFPIYIEHRLSKFSLIKPFKFKIKGQILHLLCTFNKNALFGHSKLSWLCIALQVSTTVFMLNVQNV